MTSPGLHPSDRPAGAKQSRPSTGHARDGRRILVAVDKFKGSATARETSDALALGLQMAGTPVQVIRVPVADGGDGSVAALLESGYEPLTVRVAGPTGEPHAGTLARSGGEVFVELASTCGLELLPEGRLEPLRSGTAGLGLALRGALDAGASRIVIGLGGSASTDGGLGMLVALGARVLDPNGQAVQADATGMCAAASIDLSELDPRVHSTRWSVACDVDVPLLGTCGAAAMFGPQKGLMGDALAEVEPGMTSWADLVEQATGRPARDLPGAGAAGGVGFAAATVLGAEIVSGSAQLLHAAGLARLLPGADLVITGEGRWDAQTARGKGPGAVLEAARRAGVPAAVVAGSIDPDLRSVLESDPAVYGVWELLDLAPDPAEAMRDARVLLERIGNLIMSDEG